MSFSDLITHIRGNRYRAAAEFMLQAGLVAERERDPAMIAAMISTFHRRFRQPQSASPDMIKEQILDRMVTFRWLKRDRLIWLYAQPHHMQIPHLDISVQR